MKYWVLIGVVVAGLAGLHYGTNDEARFCLTHECVGDWGSASGSVVQCEDGTWSHSGGRQGACSWHGGVGSSSFAFASSSPPPRRQPTRSQPTQSSAERAAARRRAEASRREAIRQARQAEAERRRVAAERVRAQAEALRSSLFALTNRVVALNDRVAAAKGAGSAADEEEADAISSGVTQWEIEHYSEASPALMSLAQATQELAFILSLVVGSQFTDLYASMWNERIEAFNAASAAVG